MILIISEYFEANVNSVCEILNHHKIPWFRWNGEDFPAKTQVELGYQKESKFLNSISTATQQISLNSIRAIWNRRQGRSVLPGGLSPVEEEFIQRECRHARLGAYAFLEHASWLNHYLSNEGARNKIAQLSIAESVGLEIPATLITQNPKNAFQFYQSQNEKIICKSINPSTFIKATEDNYKHEIIFTSLLPEMLKEDDFESTKLVPTLFQEYIEKAYELRVTIIGNRIFTSLIDSQKNDHTKIDWRRYDEINTQPYCPYVLPPEIEYKLLSMMRRMNLEFGAIDLIKSIDERYIFLEVNPEGQWGWAEDYTGQKITEALAEWLMHHGKNV